MSARREAATLIGARPNEVVFLSGGTEANNLAIRGIAEAGENYGRHIITSQIEHPSVREAAVVGAPSDLGEEEIVAFVAPQPGATIVPLF